MPDTPAARAGRAAAALFRPRTGAAAGEPSPARSSLAAAVGRNLGHATGILISPTAPSTEMPSAGAGVPAAAASSASPTSGAVARSLGRAAAVWFRPATTAAGEAGARAPEAARASAEQGVKSAPAGGGYARALRHSSHHFLRSLGRVAHQLWLQISGVLYLLFAIGFGAEGYRNWAADHHALAAHAASLTQMSPTSAAELGLCLVFAYFGLSAWARSRQH